MSAINRRKAYRGHLTRRIEGLRNIISEKDCDVETIRVQIERLKQTNETVNTLNDEILEEMEAEEELAHEIDEIEAYRDDVETALTLAGRVLKQIESNGHQELEKRGEYNTSNIHLPKISLPMFSGDLLSWQNFHDSFTAAVIIIMLN